MRRSKAEQVGDIVRLFMRQEGLESPYNEYKLISSWEKVMGQGIARYTGDMFIKNQTLFVKLTSPVVKNELMMARLNIVRKLNEAVGSQVITEIRFI